MQAVCLTCYTVFDASVFKDISNDGVTYNICPNMGCQCEIFMIDELMIPIIFSLNKKGYKTTVCCSGHIWENLDGLYDSLYIGFDIGITLDTLPEGFYQENYREKIYIRREHNESTIMKNPSILDIQKFIFKGINDLLEWAEGLPVLEREIILTNTVYDPDTEKVLFSQSDGSTLDVQIPNPIELLERRNKKQRKEDNVENTREESND